MPCVIISITTKRVKEKGERGPNDTPYDMHSKTQTIEEQKLKTTKKETNTNAYTVRESPQIQEELSEYSPHRTNGKRGRRDGEIFL